MFAGAFVCVISIAVWGVLVVSLLGTIDDKLHRILLELMKR